MTWAMCDWSLLLFSFIARVRNICHFASSETLIAITPTSAARCLYSIQHLNLELEPPDMPLLSFAEAPLLRTAILDDSAAISVILPWVQLTSLTLKTMCLYECVPVLQQAANLTHCELELYNDFDGTSVANVALPSLPSLTLNDPDPVVHCVDQLQTFVVPALCSLEIPERFLGPNPIHSLSSFISNSGRRLQRVWIVGQRSMFVVGSYVGDGIDSEGGSGSDAWMKATLQFHKPSEPFITVLDGFTSNILSVFLNRESLMHSFFFHDILVGGLRIVCTLYTILRRRLRTRGVTLWFQSDPAASILNNEDKQTTPAVHFWEF
ncbi:hypothetical protein DFH08DRAFT_801397 [Mycena albidolilacea]|uniref:Uncharacterized protein n=1 Tax=Mycena albidolilacea TaxID=1033008 RepID=A0AAD7AJI2_9AGAR|nr:hypothetical protein DFH08DRAFT_801397 [Mycena albidolilacea]